jgi:hypothetical protein
MNILIKRNPFYNTKKFEEMKSLIKINEILNKISPENTKEEVAEIFVDINHILNLKNLFSENFKNIFIYGLSMFSSILPKNYCSQNILLIMILFLSNPNRDVIRSEKINIIRFLIDFTREDSLNINSKRGNCYYFTIQKSTMAKLKTRKGILLHTKILKFLIKTVEIIITIHICK